MFSKEYLIGRLLVESSFKRLTSRQQKNLARVSIPSLRSADSYWITSYSLDNCNRFIFNVCYIIHSQDWRRLKGYITALRGQTLVDFLRQRGVHYIGYLDLFRLYCVDFAYQDGYVDIIKCLHTVVGFTREDFFHVLHDFPLVSNYDQFEVVLYLHKEVGLTIPIDQNERKLLYLNCDFSQYNEVVNFVEENFPALYTTGCRRLLDRTCLCHYEDQDDESFTRAHFSIMNRFFLSIGLMVLLYCIK